MSKSGQAAYDAQEQDRYADNYLAEEGERRHDIDQRITALEEVVSGVPVYPGNPWPYKENAMRFAMHIAALKEAATALTEALRDNDYPKQPEPTQLEDIPF
jgi:hypothetical protein